MSSQAQRGNRYELYGRVGGDRIVAYQGRDTQTGRTVLLHQFKPGLDHTEVYNNVIRYLLRTISSPLLRIIDFTEIDGHHYLVTVDEPTCLALREWLQWELSESRGSDLQQDQFTKLFGMPARGAPPAPPPPSPGEFTANFGVAQVTTAPKPGPILSPPPAHEPGEFTQAFAPPGVPGSRSTEPGDFTKAFELSAGSGNLGTAPGHNQPVPVDFGPPQNSSLPWASSSPDVVRPEVRKPTEFSGIFSSPPIQRASSPAPEPDTRSAALPEPSFPFGGFAEHSTPPHNPYPAAPPHGPAPDLDRPGFQGLTENPDARATPASAPQPEGQQDGMSPYTRIIGGTSRTPPASPPDAPPAAVPSGAPIPSVNAPAVPTISPPSVPAVSPPTMPSVSAPTVPSVSAPSMPTVSAPSAPAAPTPKGSARMLLIIFGVTLLMALVLLAVLLTRRLLSAVPD